ncbi:cellulose biosynthesis cyclic di-GMP-binding regulatory protein BcsB [Acaryochloris sp. IP29b_bin.148]|uniref:cellulose biosynthesis cyclic di-GMP-binding regulatory protein BcsB n=1 Tax=Acaryochloris sp. IP29b_bin.148 TaxID=2969218 RepID=UPI0026191E6F|nr:cellulose biosynthesis cyclic di-GMP-binding regulatory protein BcsB [Acaryochloris sp. IP29b_bin.148]
MSFERSHTLLCSGFALFSVLCPLPVGATSQVTSLKSLGYSRDIVLKGINPQLTFSIPQPPGGINDKTSFLNLRLKPSPFLDKDSSIRVLLNEDPIVATSVAALRKQPTLKIPIPAQPKGEAFISVTLASYLFTQQDVCDALQSGNLYLTVENDSFFQVTPKVEDQSINGFFAGTYPQVVLRVPDNLDAAQLESALWLYGLLAGQFGKRQIPVLWQTPQAKIPANSAQVRLDMGTTGPDINRQGSTLTVRAIPKVIKSLAVNSVQVPFSSQGVAISAVNPEAVPSLSRENQRISFQQLGFDASPRRGSGTQRFRINFDLAQFESRPQELAVSLNSLFTPVNAQKGDRLNGQIYLNNTLVKTYDLTQTATLKDTVFLATQNLRRTNDLDVVFEHHPSEGSCQASGADLTFQVTGDSYLAWSGEQQPEGTFNDLPYKFLGPGRMIVDDSQPELIQSTAYLLGMINQISPRPIFPKLVKGETSDLTQLINQTDDSTWQIIAVAPGQFPPSAPVRLQENFEIVNPLNQQVILSTQPADSLGLLQYFYDRDRPTLGLSWWGTDAEKVTQLASLLADPQTGLAQRIRGNVVTSTGAIQEVRSWDLSGKALTVNYPEALDWRIWLSRYRWLFILLSVGLGGGLCWYLYKKLGRLPQSDSSVPESFKATTDSSSTESQASSENGTPPADP